MKAKATFSVVCIAAIIAVGIVTTKQRLTTAHHLTPASREIQGDVRNLGFGIRGDSMILDVLPTESRGIVKLSETDFTTKLTVREGKCPAILSGMSKGKWLERPVTKFEQMAMDVYLQTERSAFRIPPTFQRLDGRCGNNLTYEETPQYKHMWFKSICNPKGSTPCCKEDRCVDLPVEECRCANCFDERQAIYPEYSTWLPEDDRCAQTVFTKEEACGLLEGATIHVAGDSFVREMYIALAILLTGDDVAGALREGLTIAQRNQCTGLFQVTGAQCRDAIFEYGELCNGTVTIQYTELWNAKDVHLLKATLKALHNKPKSFLVLGLGIHDNFDAQLVESTFIKPLAETHRNLSNMAQTPSDLTSQDSPSGQFTEQDVIDKGISANITSIHSEPVTDSSKSQWNTSMEYNHTLSRLMSPHLFWMGIHAPGLLKSPHFEAQSSDGVRRFNKAVERALEEEGIPYLNTFDFTNGVLSFDGTHYGWAINTLKTNMFLTYIRDTFTQGGQWQ